MEKPNYFKYYLSKRSLRLKVEDFAGDILHFLFSNIDPRNKNDSLPKYEVTAHIITRNDLWL